MNRLIFIGASGHGKVCAEIAELNGYEEILFLDDNKELQECAGYPVVGIEADFVKYINAGTVFFVSIGKGEVRKRIQKKIIANGGKMVTLVHPKSAVGRNVNIGLGSVVMAGAVINFGTMIEEGVIVNTLSSVDHDSQVDSYCHIAVGSHICGSVHIGENTWIGAGATVNNNVTICNNCFIGAGALVLKDITLSGTYIGIPVRTYTKFDYNSKLNRSGGVLLNNNKVLFFCREAV